MFRPMRRVSRQLTDERCAKMLERCTSGVLALSGDEGYPYAVPLSYVFEDGKIYFHGARQGHKADAVRRSDRASFCVVEKDRVEPESYTTRYASVIAFGRIREITDEEEKREAIVRLAKRYNPTDTPEHRERFIEAEYGAMSMWVMDIEHMTGKSND